VGLGFPRPGNSARQPAAVPSPFACRRTFCCGCRRNSLVSGGTRAPRPCCVEDDAARTSAHSTPESTVGHTMGMDLVNDENKYERFSYDEWCSLLNLALEYGWTPAGTAAPVYYDDPEIIVVPAEWPGLYDTNDGQRFLADDAKALAAAVEAAMDDIPDQRPAHKLLALGGGIVGINPETPLNLLETFAGRKDRLRQFIAYCRAGEFRID
jgi:hypothetical protein